jgi:3-hydroxyisobutyrate dehydrogenase-like beta-hydroxyacid dehydrogenase
MVGGEPDAVDRVMPLLQAMGKNIVHQGGPGNGQHTKMCNQIVLAGTIIGVCESLLYAYRAGLSLETMLSSIAKGAAQCWILDNLAPKMIARNWLHARDLSIWSRVGASPTRLQLDDGSTFRPGLRHARPLSGPRGPIRERLFCA